MNNKNKRRLLFKQDKKFSLKTVRNANHPAEEKEKNTTINNTQSSYQSFLDPHLKYYFETSRVRRSLIKLSKNLRYEKDGNSKKLRNTIDIYLQQPKNQELIKNLTLSDVSQKEQQPKHRTSKKLKLIDEVDWKDKPYPQHYSFRTSINYERIDSTDEIRIMPIKHRTYMKYLLKKQNQIKPKEKQKIVEVPPQKQKIFTRRQYCLRSSINYQYFPKKRKLYKKHLTHEEFNQFLTKLRNNTYKRFVK